ncbi:hypothetical protein M0R45_017539 [Rubus argutus]|uniref:Cation/H(+) antiporter C-terminal domain-containing protein n=1 Tax=Rubus argutus TaxID=59490 RepID=A0AAW1XYB3_RUBAR
MPMALKIRTSLRPVTATHGLTAFPVVALLLDDLKIINSELGRLSLSATLVCDILGVFLQTLGRSLSMTTDPGQQACQENLSQCLSHVGAFVWRNFISMPHDFPFWPSGIGGITHLACYTVYRDIKLISDSVYAVMLASVVVTSIPVPILVKYLYDPSRKYAGYERRDIMHLKPNAELKILALHSQDNSASHVNAYSANVFLYFNQDNTIRTLNLSVLERAPCSAGILVDRGHLGRSTSVVSTLSSFSVAVIFLGGKDDREALTFAKRMAKDSTIRLTVIHLVAMGNESAGGEWDKILDAEVLKDFKCNRVGEGLVLYVEEMVKDGPQTAFVLRSMVDEYDLIIVGRRHMVESPQTVGLSEWSEFPELGTIGDLLASPDIDFKSSILAIQQQQQWLS